MASVVGGRTDYISFNHNEFYKIVWLQDTLLSTRNPLSKYPRQQPLSIVSTHHSKHTPETEDMFPAFPNILQKQFSFWFCNGYPASAIKHCTPYGPAAVGNLAWQCLGKETCKHFILKVGCVLSFETLLSLLTGSSANWANLFMDRNVEGVSIGMSKAFGSTWPSNIVYRYVSVVASDRHQMRFRSASQLSKVWGMEETLYWTMTWRRLWHNTLENSRMPLLFYWAMTMKYESKLPWSGSYRRQLISSNSNSDIAKKKNH